MKACTNFSYRGNTLKIHTVKKEDRGTYFCVADNGVGKPAKRNIALEVGNVPPERAGIGTLNATVVCSHFIHSALEGPA